MKRIITALAAIVALASSKLSPRIPNRRLLDRLTHHVHILEMNGKSYRLTTSKKAQRRSAQGQSQEAKIQNEGEPVTVI